ncbi:MAG: thioredoxin family protein [Bacteroidota bacterium]
MMGFVIVGIIAAVVFGSQKEIMPVGSALPEIKYITANDSGYIHVNEKPLMIMYFKPDCPHCKYELEIMNKRINELRTADIYLITTDKDLIKENHLIKWTSLLYANNVKFCWISEEEYKAQFGINVTPVFYFFDRNNKLTGKIIGETKFDRILGAIKLNN